MRKKGYKFSIETRKKMSLAHMGHKHSLKTRKKLSLSHIGKHNGCEGANHVKWNGGIIYKCGYRYIYSPHHPNKHKTGKGYVAEHRLVMEGIIGRFLTKGEIVHHKNHNKLDNRPSNLKLMTPSEHSKMHRRIERENKCNNSNNQASRP